MTCVAVHMQASHTDGTRSTSSDGQSVVYATEADSIFIESILDEAAQQPRTTNFPLFFARKFIGRPYVAHTLELFDDERLIVNTRELDCTTLVENVTALVLCTYRNLYTYRDYLNALMSLRYRDGRLCGYTSRLHYFSDWIDDKVRMQLVDEVQQPNPPFSREQVLDIYFMSRNSSKYKALVAHPDFIGEISKQEKNLSGNRYRYIPKNAVLNTGTLRNTVKDGDIIAITSSKKGLDIAHLGFAVWREDGLHLLNASMLHKQVVEEPMTLHMYLSKHPTHTGIRIIRIRK